MFTLASYLGLLLLASAEEGATVQRRRRLAAVETCQFAEARSAAHTPNCLGSMSWTLSAIKEPSITVNPHDYRCCDDKHPGWLVANSLQQKCTAAGTTPCIDIKNEDAACRLVPVNTSYFTPGYTFDNTCNNYADDCRATLSCDTAAGYSGTADLACNGATSGGNGEFGLRGCARGDFGRAGLDLTKDVFIVAPNTAPEISGNPKNNFAECQSAAAHFGVIAFAAGNGGCDSDNSCATAEQCEVLPFWATPRIVVPTEDKDAYLNPTQFKSKLAEKCVTGVNGARPTTGSVAKVCKNLGSEDDTAIYGGFDLYGDRFSCWRNLGGGVATKKDSEMKNLDLTSEVMTSAVNAGIGKTLFEFDNNAALVNNGVWSGGADGNGWGVCDGVDKSLGGCTAELAALMCEAYNNELVANGATDTTGFCIGFVLADASSGLGDPKKKYKNTGDYKMLGGFFSQDNNNDFKYKALEARGGGYFKTIEVANCLQTSNSNCMMCKTCKAGFFVDDDGQCVLAAACPKYQYANTDTQTCDYCMPHCIECEADGQTCKVCRAGISVLSADKKTCEEVGCTVPTPKMESIAKDELTGKAQGSDPACVAGQNLVAKAACGVQCPSGKYSSDALKTVTYSCPTAGSLVPPTMICSDCAVTKCGSCPLNVCDTCELGHVLTGSGVKTCVAKACPNGGTAGACTVCPLGSSGTLGWDFSAEDWDTSACVACTVANCQDCAGDANKCVTCDSDYVVETPAALKCKEVVPCPRGTTGVQVYDPVTQIFDPKNCVVKDEVCADPTQAKGFCNDCADGFAGSVDWDYSTQKWVTTQCHIVQCPLSTESSPNCNTCPPFTTGTVVWDDMFNTWEGCVANAFGFSGPSATWSGSVSADKHVIDTKSAEMLHIANGQYDAIKEQWVCDEGYAGITCQLRLCPETSAFVSGTDSFTPSRSVGSTWSTDIGKSTSATFSNQHSYRECGGRGTCDFETGICQCFPGFTGVGCRRTTCPNSCSGHGICLNDDITSYHAAAGNNLPTDDLDINTWGNLWATSKFQSCRCDGGWGGNDCSLRQCPRGDDPETACDEDIGNDVQVLECDNLFATTEAYFKLRFTNQIGHRYNTRAIVIPLHTAALTDANRDAVGAVYTTDTAHSIQTALESLPNFAIPKLEVTATTAVPPYFFKKKKGNNVYDYTKSFKMAYELKFTDPRNSGILPIIEVQTDAQCDDGIQPKYKNTVLPVCVLKRNAKVQGVNYRENAECSNRGLCNRKTAECNCFDGYTGLACDVIAQTY